MNTNELRAIAYSGNVFDLRDSLRRAAHEIDRLRAIPSIDACPFHYYTRKPVSEKTKLTLHGLLEAVCTPTIEQSMRRKSLKWFRDATVRNAQ